MKLPLLLIIILSTTNLAAQENKRNWTIGMRSGLYIEMAPSGYYGSAHDLSTTSWSQQGFVQKKIKDRFLLEMTVTHYKVMHDLTGEKKNALEQPYLSYKFNHQRLSHTITLFYKLINSKKLEVFGGLGAGIISSLERYHYSYIDTLGHFKKEDNTLVNIEAINFSGSLLANYSITERWTLTGSSGFSLLSPGNSLSGYSLNIGIGYQL